MEVSEMAHKVAADARAAELTDKLRRQIADLRAALMVQVVPQPLGHDLTEIETMALDEMGVNA